MTVAGSRLGHRPVKVGFGSLRNGRKKRVESAGPAGSKSVPAFQSADSVLTSGATRAEAQTKPSCPAVVLGAVLWIDPTNKGTPRQLEGTVLHAFKYQKQIAILVRQTEGQKGECFTIDDPKALTAEGAHFGEQMGVVPKCPIFMEHEITMDRLGVFLKEFHEIPNLWMEKLKTPNERGQALFTIHGFVNELRRSPKDSIYE